MRENSNLAAMVTVIAGVILMAIASSVWALPPDWVHTTASLSTDRTSLAATSAGGKAFFAGGLKFLPLPITWSATVDIYDTSSGTWSTDVLSQARDALAATSLGNKAIFAGGRAYGFDPLALDVKSAVVDIYNTSSDTWSTATLSQARSWLAATTVDNKAIFAGGEWLSDPRDWPDPWKMIFSDVVDIYDASTNTWSTATLSQPRAGIAATTVGSKALFAGGSYTDESFQKVYPSDIVDIYDATNGMWSTTALPVACGSMAATNVGNKAIFAGGIAEDDYYVYGAVTDLVQIYDVDTDTWSVSALSEERISLPATTLGNKAIFAGGRRPHLSSPKYSDVVDIYDVESDTWTTTTLSQARYNLAATTAGDMAFFAGGQGGAGALETYSNVDIYQVPEPATLGLLLLGGLALLRNRRRTLS